MPEDHRNTNVLLSRQSFSRRKGYLRRIRRGKRPNRDMIGPRLRVATIRYMCTCRVPAQPRSFVFTCSQAAGLFVDEAHDEADNERLNQQLLFDRTRRVGTAKQQEARCKRKTFLFSALSGRSVMVHWWPRASCCIERMSVGGWVGRGGGKGQLQLVLAGGYIERKLRFGLFARSIYWTLANDFDTHAALIRLHHCCALL